MYHNKLECDGPDEMKEIVEGLLLPKILPVPEPLLGVEESRASEAAEYALKFSKELLLSPRFYEEEDFEEFISLLRIGREHGAVTPRAWRLENWGCEDVPSLRASGPGWSAFTSSAPINPWALSLARRFPKERFTYTWAYRDLVFANEFYKGKPWAMRRFEGEAANEIEISIQNLYDEQ